MGNRTLHWVLVDGVCECFYQARVAVQAIAINFYERAHGEIFAADYACRSITALVSFALLESSLARKELEAILWC